MVSDGASEPKGEFIAFDAPVSLGCTNERAVVFGRFGKSIGRGVGWKAVLCPSIAFRPPLCCGFSGCFCCFGTRACDASFPSEAVSIVAAKLHLAGLFEADLALGAISIGLASRRRGLAVRGLAGFVDSAVFVGLAAFLSVFTTALAADLSREAVAVLGAEGGGRRWVAGQEEEKAKPAHPKRSKPKQRATRSKHTSLQKAQATGVCKTKGDSKEAYVSPKDPGLRCFVVSLVQCKEGSGSGLGPGGEGEEEGGGGVGRIRWATEGQTWRKAALLIKTPM